MAARVVRKVELSRALDVLNARGEKLAALDVLPGGAFRLHVTAPSHKPGAGEEEEGGAAWDAALA